MEDPLLASLLRAVEAAPTDLELRVHYARQLLARGRADEAIAQASTVLAVAPSDARARTLLADALAAPVRERARVEYDWAAAESEVADLAVPGPFQQTVAAEAPPAPAEPADPPITLADVGGMVAVKEQLNAAFLAPMRNPELRELYGGQLRGGLLMYGPPGCGKTYLARALAGELGVGFVSVGLADILDPYLGVSERNLREAFRRARQQAPCVLFLDELDALGGRRSSIRDGSAMRNVVVALLQELDGVERDDDGVFVLAATNQPWDVDSALRRPGRFDRTVLVLPPDEPARAAIFAHHLKDRPVDGIDLDELARASDRLSGADIAHVCRAAGETALLDSVRTGVVRRIGMPDLRRALADAKPSTSPWFDSARNVVDFGVDDGTFDELRAYLKRLGWK